MFHRFSDKSIPLLRYDRNSPLRHYPSNYLCGSWNIVYHFLKEKDCHIGLGWDKALDIFNYQGQSLSEVNEKYRMKKKTLSSSRGGKLFRLDGGEYMKSCFEMMLMEDAKDIEISFEGRFASIVITRGEGVISTNVGDFEVKEGETYVLPASIDIHRYMATKKKLDIIISLPPIP